MTLAPAHPTSAPSAPLTPDGVEPTVTAVVITRRDPDGLAELLAAVLDQSLTPDAVLVLDRTPAGSPAGLTVAAIVDEARRTHRVPITVTRIDPRTALRPAVHRALLDAAPATLAWLLPVGTTPEVGALVALVDDWRRSPSTGILGPKHVAVGQPHLLQGLSIRTTRGGRLLPHPAPGEPDQGQYNRMSDALAVPFAGSLVERDLLADLGGWERSFGDVGADLDLGWRAQAAGRRVVVVPAARHHTEPGVAVVAADTPTRRRAARRVALARAPWWTVPALALWIAVTSVVASVGLLLLKRPRSAWAELSSIASLDPFRGTAARWRTRRRREVGRRDLRALFEPRRAVLTSWGDAVHDAVVGPRQPVGEEVHEHTPRSWLSTVLRNPGVLAAAAAAVVAAVAGRTLGLGVLTGAGSGLAGGELVGNRADAQTLWHSWADGWAGAGLGGPEPVAPSAAFLAVPARLVDALPLLPDPVSPAGFVVALLVILGMPLAAVSAYLALRPVTDTRWVRGLAAFAWATTGVASASVAQGRLGALVALVLLPPLACGSWLVASRRSTATSAFATALTGVVLGAFAPVLLAPVVVLALVLAVVRSRVRVHALVVALVPVVVLGPWLVRAAESSWPALVAGSGLAQWGGTAPQPWEIALLNPGGAGAPLVWTSVPLIAVAVLALVRGRAWGGSGAVLAVLAPLLLALALVAPSLRLGTIPAGVEGTGEPITLWAGTMLLPLALLVVVAFARGLDGIRLRRTASAGLAPVLARRGVAVTGILAVLASAVGVAWATFGSELAPWVDPRPAVSVEQADGAFATRSLFVSPGERGAGYRFVGREAADVVRPLPAVSEADAALAERVSAVLGDASSGADLFSDTATDLLAVREGVAPEVTQRLDATEGLQRIAPREGWEMWRVSPRTGEQDEQSLVAPPRLRLVTPGGVVLVPTSGQHAATEASLESPAGGRLVVAEPQGWAGRAVVEVDGDVLEAVDGKATPTYDVPTGGSRLTVELVSPDRWWQLAQVIAVLALAFLAVPFGRRESRVGGR
jgi:hypothetical protein